MDAHNDIQYCHKANDGLNPLINDGSKVHHLLNGITSMKVDATKATIWANLAFHNDFTCACDLLSTFVTQSSGGQNGTCQVAEDSGGQPQHGG
jgi:hypothetical protein